MEKKMRYNVRDTIPETPESFYDAVERSLESCRDQRRAWSWRLGRLPRRLLIPMVAAAVLLIATTAVAAGILLRDNYNPVNYLSETKAEREEQGKTIPDVEQAIASAAPESGNYTITMQPGLPDADILNGQRLAQGQPAYSEEDWGWMREIKPEILEVLYDGRAFSFSIRLHTDHGLSFNWPREDEGQWVEALVDFGEFRRQGEEGTHDVNVSGGISAYDAEGVTIQGEIMEPPFPQEGRVELTVDIGLRDARVEDMAIIGVVSRLKYTFTFDAAAAREAARPQITERKLSGSAVLTVDDWSDPNKPKMYNQRVSLDEVTLKEEVRYRQTGIYVTYTVQETPAGWTEPLTNALLYSNRTGDWHGIYIQYRIGQEGEWLDVGHENHGNFGESVVILPIFPSEYEKAKAEGVYLRLTECYGTALNGEPIAEDWKMVLGEGSMSLNFTVEPQELAVIELPLP